MHFVRARLDRDVHHAARGSPVLGVVPVRQDLHLADRFDGGTDHVSGLVDEVDHVHVVVDAVQQKVVLPVGADAVRGEASACRVAGAGLGGNDSGHGPRQERETPLAAQRQLARLAIFEGAAHLGGLGLQRGRRG